MESSSFTGFFTVSYIFISPRNNVKPKIYVLVLFIAGEYMPDFDTERSFFNRIMGTLIYMQICLLFVIYILVVLFALVKPRGPVTFGELVPREYFYWWVHLLIFAYHFHLVTLVMTNVTTMGGIMLVYLAYFTYFLAKELHLNKSKYKTVSKLREMESIMHIYRSFQVLHANVMFVMGILLVSCNIVFMSSVMWANFTLARYWENFALLIKVPLLLGSPTLTLFWMIVLDIGRILGSGSKKVLVSWKMHSWNTNRSRKLMSKFRKSCKPIMLCYGLQFIVGRRSVLKFLKGVVRGTMRALLAA